MTTTTRPRLTGGQSLCRACGLLFASVSVFDAHRIGDYAAGRQCLTPEQLQLRGFAPNERGFWRQPMTAADRKRRGLAA